MWASWDLSFKGKRERRDMAQDLTLATTLPPEWVDRARQQPETIAAVALRRILVESGICSPVGTLGAGVSLITPSDFS